MELISIIVFLIICFGLGFGLTLLVKESDDLLERILMRFGIGLVSFLTLGLILNLVRIPLDFKIFTGIAILSILTRVGIDLKKKKLLIGKVSVNFYAIIMLVLFIITLQMYVKGAFIYPYLENDDPWAHGVGSKYVTLEKSMFVGAENKVRYMDPYPPTYDFLMGVIHQTNDSIFWTLKYFNAIIISLSIIFFFFFTKVFFKSSRKALFATFVLFAIPAYLSHFIWAISLAMPLYFVCFYCVEKIKDDKKWIIPSIIGICAILATSPTHSTLFGLFFAIYFISKTLIQKKFLKYEFIAGAGGVLLVAILWWIPMIVIHGFSGMLKGIGVSSTGVAKVAGTGDRIYTLKDFVVTKSQNMINSPVGIGIVVSLLVLIALIYLLVKNFGTFKRNLIKILATFGIIEIIMLIFLWRTYTKVVPKRLIEAAQPGSIPFFEFFSDKILMILVISLSLFIAITIIIDSFKHKQEYREVVYLLWLALTFYAVNAGPFVYKLSPFRMWAILAIPIALLAAEGLNLIYAFTKSIVKGFSGSKIGLFAGIFVVLILSFGIVKTSFAQKYAVNTAIWSAGGFWTYEADANGRPTSPELSGYLWMKENIPNNANVFSYGNNPLVIALDKFSCWWCEGIREYTINGFEENISQNYNFLKQNKYEYIVIDGQTIRKYGVNQSLQKIQGYADDQRFRPLFNNNGFFIFEIQ